MGPSHMETSEEGKGVKSKSNNNNVSNNFIYSASNDGVHCTNTPEENVLNVNSLKRSLEEVCDKPKGLNSPSHMETSEEEKGEKSKFQSKCGKAKQEDGERKFRLVMGSGDVVALFPSLVIKTC